MKKVLWIFCLWMIGMGVSAQEIAGDWYGTLEISGVKLRLVLHVSGEKGEYKITMDSPDQGVKGIPATAVRYQAPELEVQFATIGAVYKGSYEEEQLKGTFTQMNLPLPLNFGRQIIKSERPQEPQPPFPYQSEEVVFQNLKAGISLAGTLTLPQGEGNFPAVVLISGSGPQNRNEELMGHKPFWVIADYLTRRGIAVFRFDDRGVGQSGGVYAKATTLDFATDVAAAVDYLRTRKEIRPSAIGIMGHSEGGMIAPVVAAHDKDIAFAVLLAGVGVPGKELLLQQSADLLKAGNTPSEYMKKIEVANRRAYDILLTCPEENIKSSLDSLLRAVFPLFSQGQQQNAEEENKFVRQRMGNLLSPWFRGFVAFKPGEYLAQMKCPVLALNGDKDLQVNAYHNLTAIYRSLQKNGNHRVDTVYLPGLNHLFQKCKTGLPDEYGSLPETFSPEALKIIGDWIKKTVK